jgi:hypothetical protein
LETPEMFGRFLLRPFRAQIFRATNSRGVAPGYFRLPLQGK